MPPSRPIVATTDAAIIGSDLEGMITIWNGGAEQIFGYRADEAIGQPIAMLRPGSGPSEDFDKVVARARTGENVQLDEAVRRRKDGSSGRGVGHGLAGDRRRRQRHRPRRGRD